MEKKKNNKKQYKRPRISRVRLDNEISLVMQSTPGNPIGYQDKDVGSGSNRDPFKPEDYHG